jgi:hypothetical protein
MELSIYIDDMTDSANLNPERLFNNEHAMMDIRSMYLKARKRQKLNVDCLVALHGEDLFIDIVLLQKTL